MKQVNAVLFALPVEVGGWSPNLLAAVLGVVLGAATGFVLGRRTALTQVRHHPPALQPPARPATADRGLVSGWIAAHDLAGDDAQRIHIQQTLRQAGVHLLTPSLGDEFDPHVHEVVGALPPADPGSDGRIAQLVRPGWTQRDSLLRPAHVLVYTRP